MGISDEVLEDITPLSPKKKEFETFSKKWKGKSIIGISKKEIINNLLGHTEQANRVAKLIEDKRVVINILDDTEFVNKYIKLGGNADDAGFLDAFAYGENTYHKSSTPIDRFMSEVVHEGTHAKDYLDGIDDVNNLWEKRARFYERQFQESVGIEKDFKTIKEMLKFIYQNY